MIGALEVIGTLVGRMVAAEVAAEVVEVATVVVVAVVVVAVVGAGTTVVGAGTGAGTVLFPCADTKAIRANRTSCMFGVVKKNGVEMLNFGPRQDPSIHP